MAESPGAPAWLYRATVFACAFLLFLLEPLAAKALLPSFGGSAAVWLSALLFFQLALLAGYFWAHLLATRCRPRAQVAAHLALVAAAVAAGFLARPGSAFVALAALPPALRVFAVLLQSAFVPFAALAATGPLLQTWWARTRGDAPYRLYALSNAGSLLGLLAYPLGLEPRFGLALQARLWALALCGCGALCAALGLLVARAAPGAARQAESLPAAPSAAGRDRVLWVLLPLCASLLLSAVTADLTANVAPVPALWVVPLAAYLLTFVVTFELERFYRRAVFVPALALALGFLAWRSSVLFNGSHLALAVAAEVLAFFVCAVVCHGELVRRRPAPALLTSFYLSVAAGGAAGGAFVAVLAPLLFSSELELPVGLLLCACLAAALLWESSKRALARAAIAAAVALLAGYLIVEERQSAADAVVRARSFYSSLQIDDLPDLEGDQPVLRELNHGSILHGAQWRDPAREREPLTYYGEQSGVGVALHGLREQRHELRIGVVGLGAGVLAAYCRPGDALVFYELDPLVVRLARDYFTFLAGCPGHRIVLGDARLSLAAETASFDLLVVDAFTGDSIPVHLLTLEAMELFARRLAPGGVLALHISNRFAELGPVVAAAAAHVGRVALRIDQGEDDDAVIYENSWMLLVDSEAAGASLGLDEGGPVAPPPGFRAWTDDFSNLTGLLHDAPEPAAG